RQGSLHSHVLLISPPELYKRQMAVPPALAQPAVGLLQSVRGSKVNDPDHLIGSDLHSHQFWPRVGIRAATSKRAAPSLPHWEADRAAPGRDELLCWRGQLE